jgi:hypothetical protein
MRSSDLLQGKVARYSPAPLFITLRRVQISQLCVRYELYRPSEQAAPNGGSARVTKAIFCRPGRTGVALAQEPAQRRSMTNFNELPVMPSGAVCHP